MLTFDEARQAVIDGLKNGSIPAIKKPIYCLNSANGTKALKSNKRWASFTRPAGVYSVSRVSEQVIFVSEDGEMAVPLRSHLGHDEIRSFRPVDVGKIGESHALGMQSLLPAA